jgi:hypothetical protein
MLKLYKNIAGQWHYWETWEKDKSSSVIHWGIVGERGQDNLVSNKILEAEIDNIKDQDYIEFDELDPAILMIEYPVSGMGTVRDVDKRHLLEDRMNQTLGWTGLGHCDGGSIGSGTMEVCCFVVDFEIARKVIEQDLKNSDFSDYSRIYLEGTVGS